MRICIIQYFLGGGIIRGVKLIKYFLKTFFQKSILDIFKNVHFEKSEKSFEKHINFQAYGVDGLSFQNNNYIFVTDNFIILLYIFIWGFFISPLD